MGTERMTNAGGGVAEAGERPRRGNTSSAMQPGERPAEITVEGVGKGEELESGQMQTRADL